MSHLGHHQQRQQEHIWHQQELAQWRQAAQAEYQRLYALPLADLAAEVMTRGFGPGGPGYDDDRYTVAHESLNRGPTILDISYRFVPDVDVDYRDGWGPEDKILREQVNKLVAEGLQQLEHASLVRCQIHHEMGTFDWAATRWGRTALDRGEVQAILHGGR
jgi:hypothetical protein